MLKRSKRLRDNYGVCRAWVRGEDAHNHKRTLTSRGNDLVSYSTTVGSRVGGLFLLTSRRYSRTTGRHMSCARRVIGRGWVEVPHVLFSSVTTCRDNFRYLASRIGQLTRKVPRHRTRPYRMSTLAAALNAVDDACRFADVFPPPPGPGDLYEGDGPPPVVLLSDYAAYYANGGNGTVASDPKGWEEFLRAKERFYLELDEWRMGRHPDRYVRSAAYPDLVSVRLYRGEAQFSSESLASPTLDELSAFVRDYVERGPEHAGRLGGTTFVAAGQVYYAAGNVQFPASDLDLIAVRLGMTETPDFLGRSLRVAAGLPVQTAARPVARRRRNIRYTGDR